jgi:hypothetical protein
VNETPCPLSRRLAAETVARMEMDGQTLRRGIPKQVALDLLCALLDGWRKACYEERRELNSGSEG